MTISLEAQQTYAECAPFYRDTELSPEILAMYRVGIIFSDPTFLDATYKFGGLAAPHRYLIISANARCLDEFSAHPEWGLCIWPPKRIFKVIGTHQQGAFAQITLLEIPEEFVNEFNGQNLSDMEQFFARQAESQFAEALQLSALPEHSTLLWLDRMRLPIGVDDAGHFFPVKPSGAAR